MVYKSVLSSANEQAAHRNPSNVLLAVQQITGMIDGYVREHRIENFLLCDRSPLIGFDLLLQAEILHSTDLTEHRNIDYGICVLCSVKYTPYW